MKMYDIITAKKQGKALSEQEIKYFVQGAAKGSIPAYQLSALLMAIYFKGMSAKETAALTFAMAATGKVLDFSDLKGARADKHSTGGVGDKMTLIAAPIAAACGVKVAKLSGKGLGHTGGTIDKLEAIPGLSCNLNFEKAKSITNSAGLCLSGATADIAPADKVLYALRDATATVDSAPLITASILSKKIASGANNIVFDVKCGSGAFCKTLASAKQLAKELVAVGTLAGLRVRALVTDMDEPLGYAIGNSVEVAEAMEVLSNKGCSRLKELCITLAAHMLDLAGLGSLEQCTLLARAALEDGKAKERFLQFIQAQGGDIGKIGYLNTFALDSVEIKATETGFIQSIDAQAIGLASMYTGAGREKANDSLDYNSGIILAKKTGDFVESGELLARVYAKEPAKLKRSAAICAKAFVIGKKPKKAELILDIIE